MDFYEEKIGNWYMTKTIIPSSNLTCRFYYKTVLRAMLIIPFHFGRFSYFMIYSPEVNLVEEIYKEQEWEEKDIYIPEPFTHLQNLLLKELTNWEIQPLSEMNLLMEFIQDPYHVIDRLIYEAL